MATDRHAADAVAAMLGSVVGATARWAIGAVASASAADGSFPWGTLLANVVGSLAIGVAASRFAGTARVFVVTGVLGGFTTMSAFAVEANQLADASATPAAIAYVAATLVACLGAAALGVRAGSVRDRA